MTGFGSIANLTTIGVDTITWHRDGTDSAETVHINGGALNGTGVNEAHIWIDATLSDDAESSDTVATRSAWSSS